MLIYFVNAVFLAFATDLCQQQINQLIWPYSKPTHLYKYCKTEIGWKKMYESDHLHKNGMQIQPEHATSASF